MGESVPTAAVPRGRKRNKKEKTVLAVKWLLCHTRVMPRLIEPMHFMKCFIIYGIVLGEMPYEGNSLNRYIDHVSETLLPSGLKECRVLLTPI